MAAMDELRMINAIKMVSRTRIAGTATVGQWAAAIKEATAVLTTSAHASSAAICDKVFWMLLATAATDRFQA
jgi:hypothetical protein